MSIRKYRLAQRLAQHQLAARANVSSTDLSRWERGLATPPAAALTRIAVSLGISADQLAREHEQFANEATPGEGYTTASAGSGDVTARQTELPAGCRKVVDLFCGAGGLSFGFEQAGEFITAAGIDLLPDRIATFTANHQHAVGIAGDITAFPVDRFRALAGDIDVVVGGPPCQGFSSIRPFRTLTEGDPRNSLVEQYVYWIGRLQPKWFVFENVVGILTHQGGTRLRAVVEGLEDAGYTVDWRVMNAALFGIPQSRERVVIVGNREGIVFRWPAPTNVHDYRSMAGSREEVLRPSRVASLPHAVTVAEAIGDLPRVRSGETASDYDPRLQAFTDYQLDMRRGCSRLTLHRATRHSPKMMEIIRHSGANINALPPGMVSSGFSSCYSRLDADTPSTTITVNFVHPASNRCIHPNQDRALTIREGARIQSFPDRFTFVGTPAQIVKQIGNAVPPKLGEVIARAILDSEARRAACETDNDDALAPRQLRLPGIAAGSR